MRRWLLPLALAGVVALVALALVTVIMAPPPTQAEQAGRLSSELRCPDCAGLSVAESTTQSAAAIRAEIGEQLASGATPEQVKQHFVERYGQWILLSPTSPLAWWLPVGGVLVAGGLLAAWLLRRPARVAPDSTAEPDAASLARIREEAEALDA